MRFYQASSVSVRRYCSSSSVTVVHKCRPAPCRYLVVLMYFFLRQPGLRRPIFFRHAFSLKPQQLCYQSSWCSAWCRESSTCGVNRECLGEVAQATTGGPRYCWSKSASLSVIVSYRHWSFRPPDPIRQDRTRR